MLVQRKQKQFGKLRSLHWSNVNAFVEKINIFALFFKPQYQLSVQYALSKLPDCFVNEQIITIRMCSNYQSFLVTDSYPEISIFSILLWVQSLRFLYSVSGKPFRLTQQHHNNKSGYFIYVNV